MPKKQKSLNLKPLRKSLVGNCDWLITQYKIIIGNWQVGEATAKVIQTYMPGARPSRGTKTDLSCELYSPDTKTISLLLSPAHAALVQEWLIFLDDVFGRVVLHYLKMEMSDKLPSQRFDLKEIKPSNLVNMRESISEATREAFSFEKYDNKIDTLRRIFGIKSSQLENKVRKQIEEMTTEMKKHVIIRHIFQHNRGKIRKTDLAKVGQQYFELLNKDGKKDEYYEDDEIILSMLEIENLNQIIKDYSEKFEVLS